MDLHKRLVSWVKYNKVVLSVYRFFGNMLIFILKMVIPINRKKILFMSYGGQKYDDSPKVIYEAMRKDKSFDEYTFVWGFTNPEKYDALNCEKVKVDTIKFYVSALSSGVWINNSSVCRGLKLKRKDILEVNTWHGTPLKKMGQDILSNQSYSHAQKSFNTIYCAQSEYDQAIFARLFSAEKEDILLSDLPRNDVLVHVDENRVIALRNELNVPVDKSVILYAPTFREYDRTGSNACFICPPIDLKKWEKKLGDKFVVLFRAHYEVVEVLGIEDSEFIRNVSSYPQLSDLMLISDMLISDYSSIYFDYSILERPMFNFSYDFDTYRAKRGLYLDLEELPCKVNSMEDDLLREICTYDEEEYVKEVKQFKKIFCPYAGNATRKVVAELKARLNILEEDVE